MMENVKIKRSKFKVNRRDKKLGIVATSYEELLSKCATKFGMDDDNIVLKLSDQTEVDEDYFEALEDNEGLFVYEKDESVTSQILNRVEKFLHDYGKDNFNNIYGQLHQVLKKEHSYEMLRELSSLYLKSSESADKSSRRDDPNWFQGLTTKYDTKEAVLKNSAESRMRGYLYKFKKDLESYKDHLVFQRLVDAIEKKLKGKRYNSSYFDRVAAEPERLCSRGGTFPCRGPFKHRDCNRSHLINPYASREQRIIFSTWNFDHIIEKSRSIVPTVKEALDASDDKRDLNADYVFELLFERHEAVSAGSEGEKAKGNLKLVHIACHDKNRHNLSCDSGRLSCERSPLPTASDSDTCDSVAIPPYPPPPPPPPPSSSNSHPSSDSLPPPPPPSISSNSPPPPPPPSTSHPSRPPSPLQSPQPSKKMKCS